MSLGLNDLKKKRTKKEPLSASESSESSSASQGKMAARPWSHRGLAKIGKSRNATLGADHYLNDDWIELFETIQGAGDFSKLTPVNMILKTLNDVEKEVVERISRPIRRAKKTYQTVSHFLHKLF